MKRQNQHYYRITPIGAGERNSSGRVAREAQRT